MEKEDAFKLLNSINEEILHQYSELLRIGDLLCRAYESEKLKLPYHLNIIDELHINENGHSRILAKLLQYKSENQQYDMLESIIDFIKSVDFSAAYLSPPRSLVTSIMALSMKAPKVSMLFIFSFSASQMLLASIHLLALIYPKILRKKSLPLLL